MTGVDREICFHLVPICANDEVCGNSSTVLKGDSPSNVIDPLASDQEVSVPMNRVGVISHVIGDHPTRDALAFL
jgi:hypothetical protein